MNRSVPDRSPVAGIPAETLAVEEAWEAVVARDPEYADRFLYGVVTTGIYCRPGCASRAPQRKHVRFFGSSAEAEEAGFRPCKRCRPDREGPSAAQRGVERAREYLDAHLDETVGLEHLARMTHMSAYHLQRTFKRYTGLTPREYVETQRMSRLKERLRAGSTVSRATFDAGFGSASRVYERSDVHLGMTPAAYRRGGAGVRIRCAVERTPLGWVLVAATDRGLCAVTMGDDAATLEAELRGEYPRATIDAADDDLLARVAAIVAYLHGEGHIPELPLDLQASAFRWRVWKALQQIPYGETRSYGEIAASIDAPGSARAIAQACAGNPVALVIPCHRVLRGDARPSGYRWGAERKLRLLELEANRGCASDSGD